MYCRCGACCKQAVPDTRAEIRSIKSYLAVPSLKSAIDSLTSSKGLLASSGTRRRLVASGR